MSSKEIIIQFVPKAINIYKFVINALKNISCYPSIMINIHAIITIFRCHCRNKLT